MLILLVASAVPVLAESVGPAQVVEGPGEVEESPAPVEVTQGPEAEDMREAVESVEREEAAKDAWLQSPEAVRERKESRTAFDELSAPDAQGLVGAAFPELLQQLDGDPARVLSDMQIEEIVDVNAALVPDREGGSQLVEMPIPIRSEVRGEDRKPIDLTLKESDGGFVSEVPATDIRLPNTLGGEIKVGEDLAITTLPGNPEVSAARFGDKDLFLGNTDTDTDTFIAPLTRGVEVFEQLRSPKSPEQFRFGLSLPKGGTLRADGRGGAEIVDPSGKRLAFVPAPYAVDAQGTSVPASMRVDGEALVVEIAHRSLDVAYPVLLDPELVTEEWYWAGGQTFGLSTWAWQETADYESSYGCIVSCWGTGLYARSKGSNFWYGPNTWGQWVYTAPNVTAYISRTIFWALRGDVNNCPTYQPHGYVGIYNVYSGYNSLGVYSPLSFNAPSYDTNWSGGNGTRHAVVGIGTAAAASQLACGHDFYVGGAAIYQADPEKPTVSVSGMPSGWFADTPAFTLTANGYDPGLGIRKTTFARDGSPNSFERPVGCNGTAASRCPMNRAETFNVSGLSFDEGKKNAYMTVEDATGEKFTQTFQTYVDMTKPDVVLSGQLAVATEEDEGGEQGDKKVEELSLPVYNLDIKATDIGNEQNADHKKRSGVRKIEVLLDGVKKQTWEQPCSDSCPMERTYALKLNDLDAEKHVLEVIATDGVGKKRERTIEFEYIPATGMKDEYVMQYFPLPDGSGNEADEENPARPELGVNVINGNLVYREKDVDVEGYGVDLEVERYYNSLLPEAENTEWGDGWTLAQTPDLQPEAGPGAPEEAMMVRSSGAVEGAIELPAAVNEEAFDPELQAVVTKEADGGYEVADATGETDTALAFGENGTVEELRTEGAASVDYGYDAGDLAEIAVDDPASTDIAPEEAAELAEVERAPSSFKYAFGLQGSADGQFKVATDVAIDPTDNTIWVADDENDRVQHFNAAGAYLGKFASCFDPSAVDVDLQGDVYVACATAGKIQKYDDKGTSLKQIAGSGTGNGQVRFPLDLALDPEGNLYVADTDNSRVQKFSAAGAFVKSIPAGGHPWGVDVAPDGRIWTAEAPQRRVSVFDPQGALLFRFGSEGSGHSQFERPVDVEVDENGFAWVTDAVNNRVQVFDSQGSYITQFGQKGSGDGQLNTDWWLRIAVGPGGDVWVTDQGNSRLHKWINSAYLSSFKYAFGLQGSADGQFKVATDVAIDPTDNTIWVADDENDRVQHFSAAGAYLGKFASCFDPSAVDVDLQGDVYVACATASKIQKHDDKGTLLKQIAGSGPGNGQVRFPLDLALDPEGNLYVADTDNSRVQKFSAAGAFVKSIPAGGHPWGVDVAPDGRIWTAEAPQRRVSVFDPQGALLFRFGSEGSGHSQFARPVDVEVDENGFAWVTDAVNNRVQVFDSQGSYITQFGQKGSGDGQLNTDWWLRIAVGPGGDVWVTDQGNSRLHKWKFRFRLGYGSAVQNDPEVEIESPGGLVESVEGEEAGEHLYEHDGDLLTSHEDEDGESQYEYDGSGRMTRVELPNGTWAEIEYGSTDGRVKKVTVDPAGAPPAKTTSFTYKDQPRSTTVILPNDPAVTYDIGEDGSILKWQNALKPPEFELIAGSLYDVEAKETATPINAGDYNLKVHAYSEEGIASIQVLANGNYLVSEKTCPQIYEEPAACKKLPDEWVISTGSLAPGILNLEMIIEDRLGQVASKRFWVNIPYMPPPPPDQPVTPKFADVLRFREEHGLDLDLDPIQNEFELNDRVFDTINDWIQGNPVAEASMDRWGAPLRTPEVAEMEWRDAYIPHDTSVVRNWGTSQGSAAYAGYYVDHRAGGIIYVSLLGSKGQQESLLASLASSLLAPERTKVAPLTPARTQIQLGAIRAGSAAEALNNPQLAGDIGDLRVDVPANKVVVASANPAKAENVLVPIFGSAIKVVYGGAPVPRPAKYSRFNPEGPVQAGDYLANNESTCSAGFGAWDIAENKVKGNGQPVYVPLQLTAGHCFTKESKVRRGLPKEVTLGKVTRNNYVEDPAQVPLDAETVRSTWPEIGRSIFIHKDLEKKVTGYETPVVGQWVCVSGVTTNERVCGPVLDEPKESFSAAEDGVSILRSIEIPVGARVSRGDSGGPAWVMGTGNAAGLITGAQGGAYGYGLCTDLQGGFYDPQIDENYICPIVRVTTIQQIVSGAASLFNSAKLASEGIPFAEPLYIGGVTQG